MDLFDLTGKVAVITGGTRGIGLMMARGLLQAGSSVYISSRKPEAGQAAVAELSAYGRVASVPADLGREEESVRLAAEIGRLEERVHILVNNAGATWGAPLAEFPASGWDKVLDLNLKAPFFLTRAFLPLLEAAGTADDPARVINVGSIDGLRVPGLPTYSYSASKAGLHSFAMGLRRQLRGVGIRVVEVLPPLIDTPATRSVRQPKMSTDALVDRVLRDIRNGRDEILPGKVGLLPLLMRLAPSYAARRVAET